MKRKKLIQSAVPAFLCTVILSLGLILGLFSYTLFQNDQQSQLLLKEYEQNVIRSFERTISQVDTRMRELTYSQNFRKFANSSDPLTVNKMSGDLLDNALQELQMADETVAILFSNTTCGIHSKVSKDAYYLEPVFESLLLQTKEGSVARERQLFTMEANGTNLLVVLHLVQRYGNLFVVLNPAVNPDYLSLCDLLDEGERLVFSVDGTTSGNSQLHHLMETNVEGLYLHYSRIAPSLLSLLDKNQLFLLPLIILAVLAIPTVFILSLHRLLEPMYRMTKSFQIVGEGNHEYRIHRESSIQEVYEIFSGFDTMMDNITTAQEESRRSQMETIQAKLQYLQLQIRPHFFLNCLKNIYSMADLDKTREIQELVLFLSQYLRYSFQDVTAFTSLLNEMEAVKGYVGLMRCMSPEADLAFSLDSEALNAKCLPLTALTFVENCFKYQKGIQPLKITVKASMAREEGVPFVKITIKNNGGGFDPQVMEEINATDPAQFVYRSEKIGIANVKYRLWHSYQGRAAVLLSSQGEEAIVTIRFPYLPFGESAERGE